MIPHDFVSVPSVAILTPFKDGNIDFPSFRWHVTDLGSKDIFSLTVGGTTGEGHLLTPVERCSLLEYAISTDHPKYMIAGVMVTDRNGHSVDECIEDAIAQIQFAKGIGYDAVLVRPPSYTNSRYVQDREADFPDDRVSREVMQFALAVLVNSDVPVLLYNIPKRTGVSFSHRLLEELVDIAPLKGDYYPFYVKDSSQETVLLDLTSRVGIICGSDHLVLYSMQHGAVSCISGSANVFPRRFKNLFYYASHHESEGSVSEAFHCQDSYSQILYKHLSGSIPEQLRFKELLNERNPSYPTECREHSN